MGYLVDYKMLMLAISLNNRVKTKLVVRSICTAGYWKTRMLRSGLEPCGIITPATLVST
ncbi:hypothetical protein N8371_08375 [Vicingaceae bacterium]|nr:hypothetical protein [Vicingaceae bacterium]